MCRIRTDIFYVLHSNYGKICASTTGFGNIFQETEMRIEHVAMYVKNLEKARNFFMKYFDAQSNDGYCNEAKKFRSYFLTFQGGARLELMNVPEICDDEKQLQRTGFIHLAFSVGSKEKVDSLTERLKADGFHVASGPRTTGDGYYESCILDSEGNQIEITV